MESERYYGRRGDIKEREGILWMGRYYGRGRILLKGILWKEREYDGATPTPKPAPQAQYIH